MRDKTADLCQSRDTDTPVHQPKTGRQWAVLPVWWLFGLMLDKNNSVSQWTAGLSLENASKAVLQDPTFAFDTSSLFPLSCSHICRDVLLPCGCPVWSNRPIMVNVTLKTCSTRGLAHFSSSSLSSSTVNSSTVGGSSCCLTADAGSLLVGCSGHVSSVTRLIPRRGRVVDIPPLGPTVAPDNDVSIFKPFGAGRSLWCFHGLFWCVLQSNEASFTLSNDMNTRGSASLITRKPRLTYPESPSDGVIKTRQLSVLLTSSPRCLSVPRCCENKLSKQDAEWPTLLRQQNRRRRSCEMRLSVFRTTKKSSDYVSMWAADGCLVEIRKVSVQLCRPRQARQPKNITAE